MTTPGAGTTGPQPPPEAVADLESFEQGQLPPSPDAASSRYIPPGFRPARTYQVPGMPDDESGEQRVPPMGRPETLEDLYAIYSRIGQGHWLRIYRTAPKLYRGKPVEGWIGDIEERLTMHEFQQRFGGGVYNVSVMGPSARTDSTGQPLPRTLQTLNNMKVPGDPNPNSLPVEDDMTMGRGFGPVAYQGVPESVQLQEARDRAAKDRMMVEMAQRGGAMSPEIAQITQQSVERVSSAHKESIDTLNRQIAALQGTIERKDAEILAMRTELTTAKADASRLKSVETELTMARSRYDEETKSLRDRQNEETKSLRDRHAEEIKRLTDEQKAEVARLNNEYRSMLDRETSRFREDRDKLIDMHNEKLRQMTAEEARRTADLDRQHQREMDNQRESKQTALETLRDVHARELNSIRESAESRSTLASTTAKQQTVFLEQEIVRLRADNDTMRRDMEALRAKLHKDPMEVVKETRALAKDVLGMRDRDEEGDVPAAEPYDLKREITGMIKAAIEKAPDVAREFNRSRVASEQQVQRAYAQQPAVMQGQPQQLRGAPPPGARMSPQQQQQAQRARWIPRPVGGPQPFGAAPIAPPSGPPPGVPRPPTYTPPPPPPPPAGTQAQPAMGVDPTAAPPVQVGHPDGPPTQAQQPAQEQPQGGQPQPLPPEAQQMIEGFLNELASAIDNGLIPPDAFARGLVERVLPIGGPSLIRQVLAMQPETLFGIVDNPQVPDAWRIIVTHSGQSYVRQVWEEAAREVGKYP